VPAASHAASWLLRNFTATGAVQFSARKVFEVLVPVDPLSILRTVYGYDSFRDRQREIIDHVIAGNDAFVLMPTGGGKSLCYQIPALARPGIGLVISPLIALMDDQVAALRQAGVKAAALNSRIWGTEKELLWHEIERGELDLLYMAPETALKAETLDRLKSARLSVIAIDEAHCVSQWGHDFRPEYRALDCLAEIFAGVPRIALTATADAPTRAEIVEHLKIGAQNSFHFRLRSSEHPLLGRAQNKHGAADAALPQAAQGRERHRLLSLEAQDGENRRRAQ
jgi:RecQ family ATP-dependent DNA helicase